MKAADAPMHHDWIVSAVERAAILLEREHELALTCGMVVELTLAAYRKRRRGTVVAHT